MPEHDSKAERLKQIGALNPHPERVRAPSFQEGGFFDPRDLVQVKYEMLRQVQLEGASDGRGRRLVRRLAPDLLPGRERLRRAGTARGCCRTSAGPRVPTS